MKVYTNFGILPLFWPVYGFFFLLVERLWIRESYTPIHCPLDDQIPFCEYFLIPYLLWFVFLIGIQIYTLLYDTESFKKIMKFIMVSYSLAIIIYMLFPNCQELRPMVFERDNIFTKFLEGFINLIPIHFSQNACTLFTDARQSS